MPDAEGRNEEAGGAGHAGAIHPPSRREPTVRTIVAAWRSLTGGPAVRDDARRTLVACSGGADSSALLLALSAVSPRPEACHVVHDMRGANAARRDADRTRSLCESLGVRFHEASVRVAGEAGNLESNARRARYAALARVARERGLRFVATGHHADDQLETAIMRMIRGAGVRGMAGIHATRDLGDGVAVVRPMLGVTRDSAAALCEAAGWAWNEDATNADQSRLRAALRARVLPALREIEPGAAVGASRTCAAIASADAAIAAQASAVLASAEVSRVGTGPHIGGCDGAMREVLRLEYDKFVELPDSVMVSLLRMIYTRIVGEIGLDRLSQGVMAAFIRGVRGAEQDTQLSGIGELELRVCEGWIEFCKKSR